MLKALKQSLAATLLAVMMTVPLAGNPAEAKTHTHADAGIAFTAPDDWSAEANGDMLVLSPNSEEELDSGVVSMFWVSESEDLEAVVRSLDQELGRIMTDIEIESEVQGSEVNGLPVFFTHGTGSQYDQPVKWVIAVVMADKPVVFLTTYFGDGLSVYGPTTQKMAESIRPL